MKLPLFPPLLGLTLLLAASAARALPPDVANDYELMWADEFEGSALDRAKWIYNLGVRKGATNVEEAVSIAGGELAITTHTDAGTHYTGFISTNDRFTPAFGYYEARICFNDSPGSWSAFWLMTPTSGNPLHKPDIAGVEMDIVEHRKVKKNGGNVEKIVHSALHWDGYFAHHQKEANDSTQLTLGNGSYHTYGLLWTPASVTVYFDDTPIWTSMTAVSHRTENIILSSEVEDASWAGYIPPGGYGSLAASTTKMKVDYVRVYRLKPSVSGQAPFTAQPFPGVIQAEDFDNGGLHVAYYDRPGSGQAGTEFGQNTVYRPADVVDLQSSAQAENGVHVSLTQKPERLEYTATPAASGLYLASVRAANSGTTNGKLTGSVDGTLIGSTLLLPTGGADTWQSFSLPSPIIVSQIKPLVLGAEFQNDADANFDSLKIDYLGNAFDLAEAEDAQLAGGAAVTGSSYASGNKYVSGLGGAASAILWTGRDGFNGGPATWTLRYAGKATATVTKALYVNGAFAQNIVFPATGDWNTFTTISGTVTLNPGAANTIELRNDGIDSRSANIDYLLLSKILPTQAVRLEAEAATLTDGAITGPSNGSSGGQVVKGMDSENASLTWSGIAGAGGPVTLKICYVRAGSISTKKSVFVNGILLAQLTFPASGNWKTYQLLNVPATLLNNSTNSVTIKNNGAADDNKTINFDYLEIIP